MKKPNGYGTVYKKSGNRRKPWTAMVTKGFLLQDGKAVQKRSAIGYYATRKEAEIALANYNQNPYDTDVTFAEVYKRWSKQKYPTLSDGAVENYEYAYKYLEPLHDKLFSKIKTTELEYAIINSGKGDVMKSHMKTLLNQMYKYAVKYDLVQMNLAERFSVEQPKAKIERKPFTDAEIKALWKMKTDESKVALIMIYTGMRLSEVYTCHADMSTWLIKGGLKTEAGRDRIIPIREKIKPLFPIPEHLMNMTKGSYKTTMTVFFRNLGHTSHDCRVTFATRYKKQDPIMLKLIMGHKIKDITKAVYTKYTVEELREYIEKVSC